MSGSVSKTVRGVSPLVGYVLAYGVAVAAIAWWAF